MVRQKPTRKPLPAKSPASDGFHKRIVAVTVFLCACFGIITLRLAFLQIVSAKDYQQMASDQYTLFKKITAVRGEIKITDKFAAEPYTVATSVEKDLVYAIPASIKDSQGTATTLAAVLHLPAEDILAKISDTKKKYVPLKKQLSDDEERKLKDLKLAGIAFEPETIRYYPNGTLLSQVLGYVGYKDNEKTGHYGLEQAFNEILAGRPGSVDQEKDTSGAWIFGGKRNIQPAINGDNLILTIDKTVQFKAEEIIKTAVEKNQADSGSIVIMDPRTGAVLAMANYPTFDPNHYSKVTDIDTFSNTATMGSYEPGSVFKPLTMAAAVDQGKVTAETTYVDTGKVEVDGYTIENSDHKAHGTQTMSQVLEESLNTGVIFAKDRIGNAEFLKYVKKFGFGQKTGIEVNEAKGDINGLQGNIKVNYDTVSFGQGISVTPIQIMQAFTALANGGKMMKPYLVKTRISPGGKAVDTEPQALGQIISSRAASMVTAMLVNVVELGHGKPAGKPNPGYWVAGKTGTAQVPRKDGRGYEPSNNIGSFIGYAPADDPKFLMLVRVNHPRTVTFAESSAAPYWGQMAQFLFSYYNIQPSRPVPAAKK